MCASEPVGVLWLEMSGCERGRVEVDSGSRREAGAAGEREEPEGTGAVCGPLNPPSEEETAAKESKNKKNI